MNKEYKTIQKVEVQTKVFHTKWMKLFLQYKSIGYKVVEAIQTILFETKTKVLETKWMKLS